MSERVVNFSPGPATLPLAVLREAQSELLNFEDSGMSILEHSHRGPQYAKVHAETQALLRTLLGVPDDFAVLFMQGGASGQFGLLPLNFLGAEAGEGASADYVVTGTWGEKALAEAQRVGRARAAADTKSAEGYRRVPAQAELDLDPTAKYLHFTSNNTVYGTQFERFPEPLAGVPLVADMSSDILSRPIDFGAFGLIYAGAQKNLGPAGVTIVLARRSWIAGGCGDIPKIFQYATIEKNDSLQNTAPTFAIYMVRKVLGWVADQGGVAVMAERAQRKADLLYGCLDEDPEFFRAPVEKTSRSRMNVVFRLPNAELEQGFLAAAHAAGLVGLKGHRSVGGVRVSMYNAMSEESVLRLVDTLRSFRSRS